MQEHPDISNQWQIFYLLNSFFQTNNREHQMSTLLALCEGYPPVTVGFPSQRASNVERFSMSWRHHEMIYISAGMRNDLPTWKHL